ncbi:hypothetical protein LHK_01993 [Laribacter hongkongensis HLHK9]|uniref:Uncharacterized protein n=1 Tax=Laribacter hongkongensis (strain HLHK9) TaxID=557598 RepID=C1D937_LARHH|nr:hypothetical protein LHK_01993 [Laribacter hongkongensis HLHK9]
MWRFKVCHKSLILNGLAVITRFQHEEKPENNLKTDCIEPVFR